MPDQIDQRKAVFGWAMYDWANSAYATTVMAAFFPIFFKEYWCIGVDPVTSTARLGMANSLAGLLVAFLAPVLGAIADQGGARKRMLVFFITIGATMTAGLSLVAQGRWEMAIVIYILSMVGFSGGNIFYDALLTVIASEKRMDYVSALGYSLGYLGGGLLFALNVWMTLKPAFFGLANAAQAVRVSFLMVGCWWLLFSLPLFLLVRETSIHKGKPVLKTIQDGMGQLKNTFREIRRLKTIFLFLMAYWLYIDGVDTVIRMALDYGLSIGFQSRDLILALLLTQFVGFPSALFFGWLGGRIGTKPAIYITLATYLTVTLWGAFIRTPLEFYMLAVMIGLVQGGIQALSRSFFARLVPVDKAAEYFGFYNMITKFSVIIGPVLIGVVALMARSAGCDSHLASRISILSISLLFISGGLLFYFVEEEKGKAELQYLSQ